MTERAPPARTTLTPEEIGHAIVEDYFDEVAYAYGGLHEPIAKAIRAARAEGRLAGLEEARKAVCQYPGTDDENPCPPCRRIRALFIEDGPKAP